MGGENIILYKGGGGKNINYLDNIHPIIKMSKMLRKNANFPTVQGMHELLAPLYYVVSLDRENFAKTEAFTKE